MWKMLLLHAKHILGTHAVKGNKWKQIPIQIMLKNHNSSLFIHWSDAQLQFSGGPNFHLKAVKIEQFACSIKRYMYKKFRYDQITPTWRVNFHIVECTYGHQMSYMASKGNWLT